MTRFPEIGSGSIREAPRIALFDPKMIPDPKGWLEQRLGPLAHFEVVGSK